MARIEHELGVRSTYYFRSKLPSYSESAIRSIHSLGHEIGYHYECLSDTRGDHAAAWDLFRANLRRFDFIGGVRTIAMHGRPLSPHDSRDLWQYYDYRDAGILREAYLDVPWTQYAYLTDTGGAWDSESNVRDRPLSSCDPGPSVHGTAELAAILVQSPLCAMISIHPERWAGSLPGWLQSRATDHAINQVKRLIRTGGGR